jgi:hypothetical protein
VPYPLAHLWLPGQLSNHRGPWCSVAWLETRSALLFERQPDGHSTFGRHFLRLLDISDAVGQRRGVPTFLDYAELHNATLHNRDWSR